MERDVLHAVRLEFGQQPDFVVWRQETGTGLPGKLSELQEVLSLLVRGLVGPAIAALKKLLARRVLSYGLCKGSSDCIGMAPGGLLLAIEVKDERGKLSEEQLRFLELVWKMGGVACVTRSREQAKEQIRGIRNGQRKFY